MTDREGLMRDDSGVTLAAQVEAVLFVADRPVSVQELSKLLVVSPDAVEDAVAWLEGGSGERGIALQRQGQALQMVSHPLAAPVVQRFLGLEMSGKLSAAALETLAIVAYRQPVTRTQIEQIRGVNPDYAVHNLLTRGLIEEVGRQNTVGRPILYGTTFEFLRAFGLRSLADLPEMADLSALAALQNEETPAPEEPASQESATEALPEPQPEAASAS
ncbi:MAG TPA: SMC-Scp complex subunit ScpB [Chloroflexota bacterium]|nr:SMC-Scp complex subunit ScpB [Chloroflexota bacterium]